MALLFTLMSLLHLIGNSVERINKTFQGLVDLKIKLKLWIKLADLLLESLPELTIKIWIIAINKEFSYINLLNIILSFIGIIYSFVYLSSEWVIARNGDKEEQVKIEVINTDKQKLKTEAVAENICYDNVKKNAQAGNVEQEIIIGSDIKLEINDNEKGSNVDQNKIDSKE